MRPSRIPLPAPLRSTPVTALRRYYERSDSCASGSLAPVSMNTVSVSRRSPCVLCHAVVPIPSPPTVRAPMPLSHATPQPHRSPVRTGARFRLAGAGSSTRPAVSSSSSYGLVVHLPLLRTPPRGDALTVDYRPESACLERTSTSRTMHARRRTRGGPPVAALQMIPPHRPPLFPPA